MKKEKLKKHIFQLRGLTYKPHQIVAEPQGNYIPILKANNITNDSLDVSSLIYIHKDLVKETQIIKKGDILIAASSGSIKVIGKNAYFDLEEDFTFGAFCKVARPKPTVFPEYLKHFFKTAYYKRTIISQVQGANINNLKTRDLDDLIISIPNNFNDQKRIAQVLSNCESLILKRKESIALLDDLLKSTFLEMFGDPVRNENKSVKKLKEFYINPKQGTKCGPFGSALKKSEYIDKGVPVWNMDNISKKGEFLNHVKLYISSSKYEDLKSYSTQNGDIIISRAGTVGKMCVVDSSYSHSIISTNLIRLRLDSKKLLPIYFISLMQYCKGRVGRLKTGPDGAFTHMNTGILDNLEFPYSSIELQNKFATIVDKVNVIKQSYQTHLQELENLYGSISQKAFKGELDLSEVEVLDSIHYPDLINTTPDFLKKITEVEERQGNYINKLTDLIEIEKVLDKIVKNDLKKELFSIEDISEILNRKNINIEVNLIKDYLRNSMAHNKISQEFSVSTKQVMFKLI